jgi:hypothetical protein
VTKTLALNETKVIQMPEGGLGGGSWSGPLCHLSRTRRRMSIALFVITLTVLMGLAVFMILRQGGKPVPAAVELPPEKTGVLEALKNEKPAEAIVNPGPADKPAEERASAPQKAREKQKKVKKAVTAKNGSKSHKGGAETKDSTLPQQSPPPAQPEEKTDWSIRK